MAKLVEVLIGPNGEVEMEGIGFVGKECDKKMAFLEEAFPGTHDIKKKMEWFMTNSDSLRRERKMGINGSDLCG